MQPGQAVRVCTRVWVCAGGMCVYECVGMGRRCVCMSVWVGVGRRYVCVQECGCGQAVCVYECVGGCGQEIGRAHV